MTARTAQFAVAVGSVIYYKSPTCLGDFHTAATLLTMMIRRAIRLAVLTSLVSAASVVVAFLLWSVTTLPAVGAETERVAVTPARPQRAISLRDRLVVGLRARLNTEVAFIDAVVMRVNHGLLPQRVVDETFFWARSRASIVRNGRTRRPIIYFQPAMVARAKRLGVEL